MSCQLANFFPVCSPSYNSQGGRRSIHLRTMINLLQRFTHVFIICGDNDVISLGVEDIYRNYEFVIKALYPRIVRISGFLRRADFDPALRTKYNLFFSRKAQR